MSAPAAAQSRPGMLSNALASTKSYAIPRPLSCIRPGKYLDRRQPVADP